MSKGGVSVTLEWSPGFKSRLEKVFGQNGELQQYIDGTILESMEPYIPRYTGALINSGRIYTIIGSGVLIWQTPYAKYLYYGLLMVDPVTKKGAFHDPVSGRYWSRPDVEKIETDIPLKFRNDGGGKRGAKWCVRWMGDHLEAFEIDLQRKAGELLRMS